MRVLRRNFETMDPLEWLARAANHVRDPGKGSAQLWRWGLPSPLAIALVLAGSLGCGGSPTSSTQGPQASGGIPAPVTRLSFTITPQLENASFALLQWADGSGASRFVIEAGTNPGGSDRAVIRTSGPERVYRWSQVPIGTLYVRVRGENAEGLGAPSNEVVVDSIDPRSLIDALFLRNGPLAVPTDPGCAGFMMSGWRLGTEVRVLAADNVSDQHFSAVQATTTQFAEMSVGQIRGDGPYRAGPMLPPPERHDVIVEMVDPATMAGRCSNPAALGCTRITLDSPGGPAFRSVRIVAVNTTSPFVIAHELGHAFGLCHALRAPGLNPTLTMGITPSGATPPPATAFTAMMDPATMAASRAVYAAGLAAGATRERFISAGLVSPDPVGLLFGRKVTPPRNAEALRGLTVVKPLCGS